MTGMKDRLPGSDLTVTLRDPDGAAIFQLEALYAAAGAALIVMKAPRLAAAAAVGALLRGMSITLDAPQGAAAEGAGES
jgi:hypothetical protein